MNSEEALERIKRSHRIAMACLGIDKPDIETEKAIEKIEKDLEVLNIIKKSITHKEKHTHELNEKLKGQKYMTISVWVNGDTDFNKVKEWLENGK